MKFGFPIDHRICLVTELYKRSEASSILTPLPVLAAKPACRPALTMLCITTAGALLVDHRRLYPGGVWRSARPQLPGGTLWSHQFPPFLTLAGRAECHTCGDLY